ncbi:DUF1540 domain-containing protein [Paenibacillus sp. J31TS4]|uniref:DUF1540 domain-containing protein n=1 Tax=Paenibacillus sp. J31TS4 TaxID=2807195 RepID=UPI001BCF2F98|nr:DUF1540 domain-containing protein [Paenibacillus sp. J31TS4]
MTNPQVKCSVDNCEYWEEGNNCSAEVIMIEIDRHAGASLPQQKGGQQYDTSHTDHAEDTRDTCCHTFEERGH